MFHHFGGIGLAFTALVSSGVYYTYYQVAKFTLNKCYAIVILQERNWTFENQRNNYSVGEYYFNDVPLSCEENFPDIARGELAKKPLYIPSLA